MSATVAAEAAGMSRVTLHRVERGELSVAMGAYMSAIVAVGLDVEIFGHLGLPTTGPPTAPARLPALAEASLWQDDVPELQQSLR